MIHYMVIISMEKILPGIVKDQVNNYRNAYTMNQWVRVRKEDLFHLKVLFILRMINYKHLKFSYLKDLENVMIKYLWYH